ncbi:hypothetical protein SCALIN_C07_0042 [Candidatus Scalindua japonica]|uniref:Uncharacterized protein n=1 Tax=Candidatus Scalindua japonica TaxID=1284222 RepID=A0A286TWL0_9BACT|nr:hypothetical protein SCALIN_C07_0042 [Candidatus Scalindua japonica]
MAVFLDIAIFLFMPGKPRIEYDGSVYHVMCREKNRREEIYRDLREFDADLDKVSHEIMDLPKRCIHKDGFM